MTSASDQHAYRRTPLEPIPFKTFVPPPLQHERETVLAHWLNIDPEVVYQPSFGGHPILLPVGEQASRREMYPELDANAAWWPLLWPTFDQAERYPDETDDEVALRILIDSEARRMLLPETGEWFPIWAVWSSANPGSEDAWVDKVNAWLEGNDDADLEQMEPGPLPDGTDPHAPYKQAQQAIGGIYLAVSQQLVAWVTQSLDTTPATTPSELWDKLCGAADALNPYSGRWAAWFDTELTKLQPTADSAIVTGQADTFRQHANQIIHIVRTELAKPNPF